MTDGDFMRVALALARESADEGEVPVGCVVVKDGCVVGSGRNRRETDRRACAHAEIEAIESANRRLGGWRLWQCDMFVTLEPCPMCAGAIVNARIPRVVYGATDTRFGACGGLFNLFAQPLNHHPEIVRGVLEPECAALMKSFFKGLRAAGK